MRHVLARHSIWLIAVLTGVALYLGSCNTSRNTTVKVSKSLTVMNFNAPKEVTQISVRPLSDPESPYQDQYQEWDAWAFDNLEPVEEHESHFSSPGDRSIIVAVDHDGFIVPQTEFKRWHEESIKTELDFNNYHNRFFAAYAFGQMEDSLHQKMQDAIDDVEASYYPAIPNWLVANPPHAAMLYPNGEVITFGPLGSEMTSEDSPEENNEGHHHSSSSGHASLGSQDYYRYDSTGQEIGYTAATVFYLYHDEFKFPKPEGEYKRRLDGYFLYLDPTTKRILSVWDFDGTQLAPVEPPARDRHPFKGLRSAHLRRMKAAQDRVSMSQHP